MLSKKLLSIQECQFSLPDDFDGTLGDALMLLAKKRLEAEVARCEKMLSNPGFVNKAPQAKIEEEKAKLEKYKEMLEKLK